jgi:Fe-S-cluster containining protein
MPTSLELFATKSEANRKRFRSFINKLENSSHVGVLTEVKEVDAEVWRQVDCLSCSNCCRKMAPTLKAADKKRIATHLRMSVKEFSNKYLDQDTKSNEWSMKLQPCPFLDLTTNMCTIYEVRPADCSGFPHLTKTPLKSYIHIHKQNIMYCPATYLFIEKLMSRISFEDV